MLDTIATACLWDIAVPGGQVVEEDHVPRALGELNEIRRHTTPTLGGDPGCNNFTCPPKCR